MKTEKALITIFFLSQLANMADVPGHIILLCVSLGLLSFAYLLFAFYFFADGVLKRQNLILSIVSGILLSIAALAVLFKLMYYPGYIILSWFAIPATSFLFLAVFLAKKRCSEDLKIYYRNLLARTGFWLTLNLLFYFVFTIPTLLKIQNDSTSKEVRRRMQSAKGKDDYYYYEVFFNLLAQKDSVYRASRKD